MRTYLRGKITLLFMTFGLLLAIPAIALADNVVNNVSVTPSTGGQKQVTVEAGQTSAAVAYRINATGGDTTDTTGPTGQNCNPVVKPAQLTISGLPAGVSVKDSTGNTTLTAPHLTFTTCGVDQLVKFAVANNTTPGNYAITVADITNNGYTSGDFAETNGTFNLVVTADVTVPDTTIDTGPSGTVNSSSATFTFSSNEANSTFETRLDNGAWVANGTATSKTYNSLSDASHTFDVRATDAAGNVDQSPASRSWTVQTDSTPPVITPDVSGTLGNNGWYTSNVSVSWTVTDAESAVTSKSASCDTTTIINTDTTGQTVSCTATSAGGTDTKSVTIKRDATAPVINDDGTTQTPNGALWFKAAVVNDFSASDATSGLADSTQASFTKSSGAAEGSAVKINSGSVSDKAGNTNAGIDSAAFKIDLTNPVANCDSAPSGWSQNDVNIRCQPTDALSGLANIADGDFNLSTSVAANTETSNASTNSRSVADAAGNSVTAGPITGLKVDKKAPVLTDDGPTTTPDGANGWYKSAVTNGFKATDGGSGFAPSGNLTDSFTKSSGTNEGAAVKIASGAVSDAVGNSTASIDSAAFKIDLSDPYDVTFVGGPNASGSYDFGNVPAAPTCTAKDDVSDLPANGCVVSGYSSAVGSHTLTATATDNAGRTATATRSYTVAAASAKGFYSPVDMGNVTNTVKGGSTVPLKFELFGGVSNTEQKALNAVSSVSAKTIACGTTPGSSDAIEEIVSTNATGLRFDTTGDQFIYNWKTPKSPGTCYLVTMTAADNTTKLLAYFKLS